MNAGEMSGYGLWKWTTSGRQEARMRSIALVSANEWIGRIGSAAFSRLPNEGIASLSRT